MFAANRYAWNIIVEKAGSELFKLTKQQMDVTYRPYVQKTKLLDKTLDVFDCHNDCFDSAYNDVMKARKAIIAASKAQKNKTGTGFAFPERLKFRSKKQMDASIEIRGRDITYNTKARTLSFYSDSFKDPKIRMKTDLTKFGIITHPEHSCRLVMDFDKYFLNIPYSRNVASVVGDKVCAIDPGVRTFLTCYDPENGITELANNNTHLYKKKRKIEQLQKTLATKKLTKNKKNKITKMIRSLYRKIRNCVADLHHKTSKLISTTYSQVLLPIFETKQMIQRDANGKRKIGGTTANDMLTLSHYKFRKLLEHKMKLRKGNFILCTEEYTSMACGNCGRLNRNLGASKTFKCPWNDCGLIMDRDMNAARNIYILNHDKLRIG